MLKRRGLITGFAALLAAPAVVRAASIMPVRSITPVSDYLERMGRSGLMVPPGLYKLERSLSGAMLNMRGSGRETVLDCSAAGAFLASVTDSKFENLSLDTERLSSKDLWLQTS